MRAAEVRHERADFSAPDEEEAGLGDHIASQYLLRYAQEATWREDNRREANGAQLESGLPV